LAEDLIIWSSPDFGVIELPDDFTSTSSIMPQKKNPEILEVIRARASHVLGDFVASAAAVKSLPSTYNLDFQEVTPKLWESIDSVSKSLEMFAKLIPHLKVTTDVSAKAIISFVPATELANILFRKYGVPFRSAHKIVGFLVKSLTESKLAFLDVTPELLEKTARDILGIAITVDAEDIASIMNPLKLVETHSVKGGPAPSEVKRALAVRKKSLVLAKTDISKLEEILGEAENKLESTTEAYSSENGRLKNSKL
jgi:argininosuccinate lyase